MRSRSRLHSPCGRLEVLEHAVDEPLDRPGRLEPEAQEDRVRAVALAPCAPRSSRSRPRASPAVPAASGVGRRTFAGRTRASGAAASAPRARARPAPAAIPGPPRGRPEWRGRSCGSVRGRRARCRPARSGRAPRGSRASGRRAAGSATRSSRARRVRQLPSQCPAMRRPLAEQREHGPFAGSEIAFSHYSISTDASAGSVFSYFQWQQEGDTLARVAAPYLGVAMVSTHSNRTGASRNVTLSLTRAALLGRGVRSGAALVVAGGVVGVMAESGQRRSDPGSGPGLRPASHQRRAARLQLLHAGDRGVEHQRAVSRST